MGASIVTIVVIVGSVALFIINPIAGVVVAIVILGAGSAFAVRRS